MNHPETHPRAAANFEIRLSSRWVAVAILAWAAAIAAVGWPAFLENLEAYRALGDSVYHLAIVGLAALSAATLLHRWLRRWTARFEAEGFVAAVVGVVVLKEPIAAATLLLLCAAAFAIGRFVQTRLALETDSIAADFALAGSLGLATLILALMALGSLGFITTWSAGAILVGPCLLLRRSLAEILRSAARLPRFWRDLSASDDWLPSIAIVSLSVFSAFALAVSLTPTISADALRYHLPSAVYYFQTGSLAPVPGLTGSHLPQACELLMTLAYGLGGLPAAQLVSPLFLSLCAVLIYALARSCGFGPGAGIAAVIAGLCTPFVHWSGSVPHADLAVAVFQLASLICFIRGRRSTNANWLLAGLAFLALSAGSKLTAIYGALPLGALHIYLFFRLRSAKVRFRPAQIAALALLVIAVAPFWQIRNFLIVGNPWYPMNTGLLTKVIPPLVGERPGRIEAYFQYPWIVHFRGRMSFEGESDNPVGLFLAAFAPVWLLVRRRRPSDAERACLFFALLSYLYWGHMWAFVRYGIPMMLIFYCLTAGRTIELSRHGGSLAAASVNLGLLACVLFSVVVTARYEINLPQLQYMAGRISKHEFLTRANRAYPVVDKFRQVATPGERVFSIENRDVLYAPNPALFTYTYYRGRARSAERAHDRLFERLAARDYHYLILPVSLSSEFLPSLVERYQTELLHRDKAFLLYRITPL